MVMDAQKMENKAHISDTSESRGNMDPQEIRRILIVAPNWIGDTVLALPAIGLLRKAYPDSEISLVGPPHIADLFQKSPYVNRVLGCKYNTLKSLLLTASILRRKDFDMAILLPNSMRSALLAYLAGIPLRAGYIKDSRRILLSIPIKTSKKIRKAHMKEYYLHIIKEVAKCTGSSIGETGPVNEGLHLAPEEITLAKEILNRHNIREEDLIVGINPGAAYGPAKRWYPERFAEVARRLYEEYGGKVIIFGGKSDGEISKQIVETGNVPVLNLAGRTTIRELMALISQCKLFITNDSGPMHIAAALSVPVVAIFGSTDPGRTSPIGEGHVIIKKDIECSPCFLRECPHNMECMDMIGVEDIMRGVEKIIR